MQNDPKKTLLRRLPGIDHLLALADRDAALQKAPHAVVVRTAREIVAALRSCILLGQQPVADTDLEPQEILRRLQTAVSAALAPNLVRTVNATGVESGFSETVSKTVD